MVNNNFSMVMMVWWCGSGLFFGFGGANLVRFFLSFFLSFPNQHGVQRELFFLLFSFLPSFFLSPFPIVVSSRKMKRITQNLQEQNKPIQSKQSKQTKTIQRNRMNEKEWHMKSSNLPAGKKRVADKWEDKEEDERKE